MKDYYIIQPLYLMHSTEDKARFIHQKMKRSHNGQNRREETYSTVLEMWKKSPGGTTASQI